MCWTEHSWIDWNGHWQEDVVDLSLESKSFLNKSAYRLYWKIDFYSQKCRSQIY